MYNTKAQDRFNELNQCEGYTVDAKGDMIRIETSQPASSSYEQTNISSRPQVRAAKRSTKSRRLSNTIR